MKADLADLSVVLNGTNKQNHDMADTTRKSIFYSAFVR